MCVCVPKHFSMVDVFWSFALMPRLGTEWTISSLLWGLGRPQDIPQKDLEKLVTFPIKQVPDVKLEKPKMCKRDFRQKSTIDHKPH